MTSRLLERWEYCHYNQQFLFFRSTFWRPFLYLERRFSWTFCTHVVSVQKRFVINGICSLIYILNNALAIIFDTLKIQLIIKGVKGYPWHCWYIEPRNREKSFRLIWQHFSCLLDEWIAKISKKFFFTMAFRGRRGRRGQTTSKLKTTKILLWKMIKTRWFWNFGLSDLKNNL